MGEREEDLMSAVIKEFKTMDKQKALDATDVANTISERT